MRENRAVRSKQKGRTIASFTLPSSAHDIITLHARVSWHNNRSMVVEAALLFYHDHHPIAE